MNERDWRMLRDWLRRVFGPAQAAQDFYEQVEVARRIGTDCPCELGPGF